MPLCQHDKCFQNMNYVDFYIHHIWMFSYNASILHILQYNVTQQMLLMLTNKSLGILGNIQLKNHKNFLTCSWPPSSWAVGTTDFFSAQFGRCKWPLLITPGWMEGGQGWQMNSVSSAGLFTANIKADTAPSPNILNLIWMIHWDNWTRTTWI